ncbi:hypothetical protein HETIRDRAFT_237669, partial [Heterobasidion irregulare TC 32-1]
AYALAALGAAYLADRELYASTVARNLRTFWTCAVIAADYKLNFTPDAADGITALHERVGERVFNLLTSNGGLYIKFGQAIGANAALLPRPIQRKFARLFDDAPQIPYADVDRVFRAEFGRPPSGPDGVFAEFEEHAVASASVAQVHRARLKPADGGEWVAVKVQKPAVGKQMEPDLAAFRAVMWMYEHWLFDLPVYFMVDFISEHLRQELDFENEARNADRTAAFVAADPALRERVHIPKVHHAYTTKRVMTAEWIDGVRMSDREGILRLMGEGARGLPPSTIAPPPLSPDANSALRARYAPPLKGGVRALMHTMVDLFSAQIFRWGWVHCDPHPGNVLVRAHPSPAHPHTPQLVLLDHGLYVCLPDAFRAEYARLWKGLLAMDMRAVEEVTRGWGIGAPDLFASATLLKPVSFAKEERTEEEPGQYEAGVRMKEKLKGFLLDTDKMPKELIFIGRNMRIVQGNNQMLGSPVNRIKLTGLAASRALADAPLLPLALHPHPLPSSPPSSSSLARSLLRSPAHAFTALAARARAYWHHALFLAAVYALDAAFYAARARQWLRARATGAGEGAGFEDALERSMRTLARRRFGIEMDAAAFEG